MSLYTKILPACVIPLVFLAIGCNEQVARPVIVGTATHRAIRPQPTAPIKPKWTPPPKPIVHKGQSLKGRTIIVDAGHGGKDPGAGQVGYSRVPEKTIVLDIAKDIESMLKAEGARVIMTRKGDYFVELEARAVMAERYNADLLISVHADSNRDRSIQGPSIYVARGASYQSRRIANAIHSAFRNMSIPSRGIRKADFKVLANHTRPAVLVESGYLTNSQEARSLNTNWYRGKIAKAVTAGVVRSLALGN